jgi:prolyl-tRNA editing enzyme YbaK/EbsC (Cys-tRNA(Pro) deacylase)
MRFSDLFGKTLRHAPANEGPGSGLAQRCALLRFSAGSAVPLPLGVLVIRKMMDSLWECDPTAQRVSMPPGTADSYWDGLLRMEVQSYRQLPLALCSERWLANPNPHLAMVQPGWKHALQWLWVEPTQEDRQAALEMWIDATSDRLKGWQLNLSLVDGTKEEGRWFFDHDGGSENIFECTACGYRALEAAAKFERGSVQGTKDVKQVQTVATPGADTIEALAEFLAIDKSATLKAVFLTAEELGLVFVVLRGDLAISLPKLEALLGVESLKAADESLVREAGMEPGYAGPVGLPVRERFSDPGVLVVGDDSIRETTNMAAGANEPGHHLVGVRYPRDFSVTVMGDVALAYEGAPCFKCGEPLASVQGFSLAGWGSYAAQVKFASEGGDEARASSMLATIEFEPLLAALIETHRDEKGLSWPADLAPFLVSLLDLKSPQEGESIYRALQAEGVEVLYDDRDLSAGVKFTDSDLLGFPVRVTVGRRSLEKGGVEVSFRGGEEMAIVPIEDVVDAVQDRITQIM